MTNLTKEELNQLKKEYCFRVTDNMDLDTLIDMYKTHLWTFIVTLIKKK